MNEADATRERVLNATEDLDYGGPDPLASSLRQGPSGIVGVFAEGPLLNSFSDPFAVSVLDGLAQRLRLIEQFNAVDPVGDRSACTAVPEEDSAWTRATSTPASSRTWAMIVARTASVMAAIGAG